MAGICLLNSIPSSLCCNFTLRALKKVIKSASFVGMTPEVKTDDGGLTARRVRVLSFQPRFGYTISPAAGKEVLRRLLGLNQERAGAEKSNPKTAKAKHDKKSLSQLSQSEFS